MVSQLQDEVIAAKAERDEAEAKANIAEAERDEAVAKANEIATKLAVFKLKCQNKTPEEIADRLGLSVEYVNSVLESDDLE